jgi:hypothetical protein
MKILFVLMFGLMLYFVRAQTWCAPGAEWHYRALTTWPSINYQDGYIRVASVGTVTALGQTCQNLSATFYGIRFSVNSPSVVVNNYFTLITYENNKVYYAYNTSTNSFDTLVNFNAQPGDKWTLYREGTNCSMPRSIIVVSDTGHIVINGQNLRTINNYYIEKIGSIGSMIPFNNCNVDGEGMGTFVCYSDNNFPLYKKPGYTLPCDFTTVGRDEFTLEGIELKMFPNPGTELVKIEFSGENDTEHFQVQIVDLLGKRVLEINAAEEINISSLKVGLYTLNIISEGRVLARRKLVKTER